jgi:hypothetical protein
MHMQVVVSMTEVACGGSTHVRRRKADHDTMTDRRLGGKGSSADDLPTRELLLTKTHAHGFRGDDP